MSFINLSDTEDEDKVKLSSDWFVDKVPRDLTCGHCLNVLTNPHQCVKGHLFCKSCLLELVESDANCSFCEGVLVPGGFHVQNLLAQNMIGELKVRCGCRENQWVVNKTCAWTGTLDQRERRDCEHNYFKCANQGCASKFKLGFQGRRDVATHSKVCGERPIQCACKLVIPHSRLNAHHLAECVEVEVICPLFEAMGSCETCNGRIKRGVRGSHLGQNSGYILRSLGEQGGLKRKHDDVATSLARARATSVSHLKCTVFDMLDSDEKNKVDVGDGDDDTFSVMLSVDNDQLFM